MTSFPNRCAWAPPPGAANDPGARTASAEAVTLGQGFLRFGLRGLYVLPKAWIRLAETYPVPKRVRRVYSRGAELSFLTIQPKLSVTGSTETFHYLAGSSSGSGLRTREARHVSTVTGQRRPHSRDHGPLLPGRGHGFCRARDFLETD
jgi:hypothetical protein